jgi:hypothetical protein
MFIQTITDDGNILATSRDKRTNIMEIEDWEIYDFNDPSAYELREYKNYLEEQLKKIDNLIISRR